jgi:hypothetical protein
MFVPIIADQCGADRLDRGMEAHVPVGCQDVEIKFMSPLDNDEAIALDKFVTVRRLDERDRGAWAQFLLSLLYRNPECVRVLKDHLTEVWAEGTDALEGMWAANRTPQDRMTFAEETSVRLPGAPGISASQMLMDVIAHEDAVPDIANMHWTRVELSRSKYSLLTSDRPLVMPVGLGHQQCYIALPVGPRHLFVAAHDDRFSRLLPTADHNKIAKTMNKDVVRQARQYVWGEDDSQLGIRQQAFCDAARSRDLDGSSEARSNRGRARPTTDRLIAVAPRAVSAFPAQRGTSPPLSQLTHRRRHRAAARASFGVKRCPV